MKFFTAIAHLLGSSAPPVSSPEPTPPVPPRLPPGPIALTPPSTEARQMPPLVKTVAIPTTSVLAKRSPLSGPPAPWRTRGASHAGSHGFVAVVGESHYQETLRSLSDLFEVIGRTERTFTVKLVPEPTSPFDPNSVVVMTEGGATVGHLAREMAKTYQKRLLRQPEVVLCPAQLRGGADGQNIGVVLDFEEVHV